MEASSEDLRRWVEGHRAAERRQREDPPPDDPLRAAFELIDFAAATLGWPLPEDSVGRREDEEARLAWTRLRRALG